MGGEEAVVIAAAATEAMAFGIEGDTGNEGHVDEMIVGEEFACGLHDVESTLMEILGA